VAEKSKFMKIAILETKLISIAKKFKAGLEAAEGDAVKLASFVESNQTEITALATLAGPGASAATGVGLGLLNTVITAVKGAGDAASANGLSVSLDSSAVAEVKAVIAAIEKI
jgi:hypothetical protein